MIQNGLCDGCRHAERIKMGKGRDALRCMAPGALRGRVTGTFPEEAELPKVQRPRWCDDGSMRLRPAR